MKKVLLSICISSYNRGDKCLQLVKRILTVQDERYNIFICDDHSNEDTLIKLRSLTNYKVALIQNEKNLGACSNWFKTIDCGNGTYILHVLDRDDIDVSYLMTILNILEQNSVGGGYFGKSEISPLDGISKQKNFAICKKGREASLMMGVPVHPTGFFVEREMWEKGDYKKFFYESDKYGIYPHAYILGIIASKRDMLYSPIPFYYYMYRLNNKSSRFYEKNIRKDYWWLPDSVIKTDNQLLLYLSKYADDSYKKELVYRRFKHGIYRATILYKKVVANQMEMERYGLQVKNVSTEELLLNSLKYRVTFNYILNRLQMRSRSITNQINEIWYENIKTIMKLS